jgi:Tetratricopeptide repeat/Glycosyltransferase family 9 (heptosyltransferase)
MFLEEKDLKFFHDFSTFLFDKKSYEIAIEFSKRALKVQPRFPVAWVYLGLAQERLKLFDEAIISYENAKNLDPDFLSMKSIILISLEYYDEALNDCLKLVSINQNDARAWHNLGFCLEQKKQHLEATQAYQKAIDLQPEFLWRSYWNQGRAFLTCGDWKRGLARYECRLKQCNQVPLIKSDQGTQVWSGEDITGKTLLVHHDGGLGDSFHFLRYIPHLGKYRCKVLLFIQPELRDLFQHLGVTLIDDPSLTQKYDAHVFTMSLPYCFKTEISTVPPPVTIECSLSPIKGRIGIVWRGGAENPDNKWRSLDFDQLKPLLKIPGLTFVCAQKEVSPEDAKQLEIYGIQRPEINSFADTVRVLERCERLICVDTSVGHLAASMGIPTWILIAYTNDWRWLLDRTDSPWYPSVKLFRQSQLNRWDEPIREVISQLSC